jgi:type IV secretory pathway TraG/TraD family ATPase VirD4
MSVRRAREVKRAITYGSARWAEVAEVRRAGLLGADGVQLGRWRGEYLRHDGPDHVLCFAPTRSGKGVGLLVPTLLTWPGSAIVHDIKGENWTVGTARHHFERSTRAVRTVLADQRALAQRGASSGASEGTGTLRGLR